jgi:serine/threonine protein kinase
MDKLSGNRHTTQFINNTKVINGYTLTNELGSGAFGEVLLGNKGGKKFAIKLYNHKKINKHLQSEKLKEMIDTEIVSLKLIDHPNIIKVYEVFLSELHVYLVMDYINGGDLFSKLMKSDTLLSEKEAQALLRDISDAMDYASQKDLMHRDIKPENILVQGEKYILADFGLAKVCKTYTETFAGTRPFMAPQILNYEKYSSKCDVWSLGMTVFIFLFGEDPFGRVQFKEKTLKQVRQRPIPREECGKNIKFPDGPKISDGLKAILQGMLEYEEESRLSWGQVVEKIKNLTGELSTRCLIIGNEVAKQVSQETEVFNPVRATPKPSEIVSTDLTFKDIYGQLERIKDSKDIFTTDIEKIIKIGHQPETENEVESIEKFLLYKSRLCELFLSLIFQIKEVSEIRGMEEFKGWLSAASALMCKKLTEICEYCFGKLNSKHKFTCFVSSGFHQNGFAKQYLKEFYNLNQNAGPLQDEAVDISNKLLNQQLEHKAVIIEVASSKCYHPRYQNIYNLVAYYCIRKFENFRTGKKLSMYNINLMEQIIGWIYFVGVYDENLLSRAHMPESADGFDMLIKQRENPKYIKEMYELAKKHFTFICSQSN